MSPIYQRKIGLLYKRELGSIWEMLTIVLYAHNRQSEDTVYFNA